MLKYELPIIRKEVVAVDYKVWAKVTYKCKNCGGKIDIWLAVGVEGPKSLDRWLPLPFSIACDECSYQMVHFDRENDLTLREPVAASPGYLIIPDYSQGEKSCGRLVIAK